MLRRSSLLKNVLPGAAVAAMLAWAGPANASIILNPDGTAAIGLQKKEMVPDPLFPDNGLFITNIYIRFSEADDVLTGMLASPGMFTKNGSDFYQHPNGTDIAPLDFLLPIFPNLANDSFVTIGLKDSSGGTDNTTLGLDWNALGFQGGNSAIGDWSDGNPADPQGLAGLYPKGNEFWVLVAQLTVLNKPGNGVFGTLTAFWKEDAAGGALNNSGSFKNPVPSPGALALLGLAGLVGARRRRRR